MWAFLKVRHSSQTCNIDRKLRLQLFKPRKARNVAFPDIFGWWKSGHRRKFSSSLYVTLRGTSLNELRTKELHSSKALAGDHESSQSLKKPSPNNLDSPPQTHKWDRRPHEACKIPNNVRFRLPVKEEGSMTVRFSGDGLKLACGTQSDVLVYSAINGSLLHTFRGHLGLIYDLCWSPEGDYLMSCSSDSTVRIWEMRGSPQAVRVLAHPSYVYCCRFLPGDASFVISGCFDCVLRVWQRRSSKYRVVQELSNHLGYVSALCFSTDGQFAYSSDKQGVIVVWKISNPSKQREPLLFEALLKVPDIHGEITNCLVSHPAGRRLVVHTRDSQIKVVDLPLFTATHKLLGHLNMKERLTSCVSPCGSWILCGSEDGSLHVWNADSGDLLTSLYDLPFQEAISCVDFHPFDHMMAIASRANGTCVLLMDYEEAFALNLPLSVQPVPDRRFPSEDCVRGSKVTEGKGDALEVLERIPEDSTIDSLNPREKWDKVAEDIVSKLDVILKMNSASKRPAAASSERQGQSPLMASGVAVFDYRATASDELSLTRGEVVSVLKRKTADWTLVANQEGKEGLVPTSYLQITEPPPVDLSIAKFAPQRRRSKARIRRHAIVQKNAQRNAD